MLMSIRLSAFDEEVEENTDTLGIDISSILQQRATPSNMITRQEIVLLALVEQQPKETFAELAERCGVSRTTIWRYLQDDNFHTALRILRQRWVKMHLGRVNNALINLALEHGTPGQVQAARTVLQYVGELKDSVELTGKDGGPVQVVTVDVESLSPQVRELLLNEIKLIGTGSTKEADKEEGESDD